MKNKQHDDDTIVMKTNYWSQLSKIGAEANEGW